MSRLRELFIPTSCAGLIALLPMLATAFESYDSCVAAVATDPATTIDAADKWARFDGGWPAKHCRALALIAAGAEMQGARELAGIAADAKELPPQVRSEMFAHAGDVFLQLDQVPEAKQSLDRALNLATDPAPALTLRAAIKAAEGDHRGAITDLSEVMEASGPAAGLLILRSEARHATGDLVGARDDANRAIGQSPENADAWYRSGQIEAELGNKPGARDAWLKTIDLARGTPLAQQAQINLQRMDLGQ
ncbi:MAG: hypothetical protein AAGD47_02120 [Pseudomonadota bacterium]